MRIRISLSTLSIVAGRFAGAQAPGSSWMPYRSNNSIDLSSLGSLRGNKLELLRSRAASGLRVSESRVLVGKSRIGLAIRLPSDILGSGNGGRSWGSGGISFGIGGTSGVVVLNEGVLLPIDGVLFLVGRSGVLFLCSGVLFLCSGVFVR